VAAEPGFARGSAGYSGSSDGWTDLAEHGVMTWSYASAGPGTVALMGELIAPAGQLSGVLALGFGTTADAARAAATASRAADVGARTAQVRRQWTDWAARLTLPAPVAGLDAELAAAVRQSAVVLQVNEDRTVSGAYVAGLAMPWGDATNDPGGYHLVWCRDAVETG
jgi:glucoamylase